MPSARNDPYPAFNFQIDIDNVVSAGFSECSGLSSETDVVEYREGTDRSTIRKLPGVTRFAPVTLKRGLTANRDLWNWRRAIVNGDLDRRTVRVTVLNEARQAVARFVLHEAWPSKWTGPVFRAKASEVAIEELELVHEGLDIDD